MINNVLYFSKVGVGSISMPFSRVNRPHAKYTLYYFKTKNSMRLNGLEGIFWAKNTKVINTLWAVINFRKGRKTGEKAKLYLTKTN